jgi:hypothetical protein
MAVIMISLPGYKCDGNIAQQRRLCKPVAMFFAERQAKQNDSAPHFGAASAANILADRVR